MISAYAYDSGLAKEGKTTYCRMLAETISNIRQDHWDALAGDNVYISYGWLKTVEETHKEPIGSRYLVVYDWDGKPVGATVCYIAGKNTSASVRLDPILQGKYRRILSPAGISFLPALVCCPMYGYGTHFLISGALDSAEKRAVAEELLAGVENLAARERLPICFQYVMDHEKELLSALEDKDRGYNKTLCLPINYIPVEWSSFEGYLDSIKGLGRSMKTKVRREIKTNGNEGVVIEPMENVDECADRLHEILDNHYLRLNGVHFPYSSRFIPNLRKNLGNDVIVNVASKKGRITAVGIVRKKGKCWDGLIVGVDHELAGNDFTYFNITLYKPIADAIAAGAAMMVQGSGVYEAKMRKGCKVARSYLFHKSLGKTGHILTNAWFRFHSSMLLRRLPPKVWDQIGEFPIEI